MFFLKINNIMKNYTIILLFVFSVLSGINITAQNFPKIIKHGNAYQLIINDKPFIMRAGELGNSNASTVNYMEKCVWENLKKQNINTALVPVYWELIEPEENNFDFTLVKAAISGGEKNNIKIVFLWFGAWKNSMSCYVPSWIKKDVKRFPRVESKEGIKQEILSPYSQENLKADKKAFCKLMEFIKQNDKNQTVIMVQVENEIAMLPSARDYSKTATPVFKNEVPAALTDYLSKHKKTLTDSLKKYWSGENSGSWEKLFGQSIYAEEIFSAWSFAVYTNEIAKAGKKVYNLPMYANCALNRPGKKPGEYPSGGPLPHLIDIWKAGAPCLEMLSPDIYFGDFKKWTKSYFRDDNPFFIPEHQYDATAGAKALYAIGEYHALGFSPFSVETKQAAFMPPVLGATFEEKTQKGNLTEIPNAYNLIKCAENEITTFNGTDKMRGFLLDTINQRDTIILGGYEIIAKHDNLLGWSAQSKQPGWRTSGAILINTDKDEFMLIGTGIVLNFKSLNKKNNAGILEIKEISTEDGKTIIRYLNGDESHQGRHVRITDGEWGIQKFKLYEY